MSNYFVYTKHVEHATNVYRIQYANLCRTKHSMHAKTLLFSISRNWFDGDTINFFFFFEDRVVWGQNVLYSSCVFVIDRRTNWHKVMQWINISFIKRLNYRLTYNQFLGVCVCWIFNWHPNLFDRFSLLF